MLEEVNISGEWWLPYHPEKKVKGKLTFNQNNGVILELEEDLVESSEIILGLAPFDNKITLKDCFLTQRQLPNGQSTMFANFAFIGEHFEKIQDIKFSSILCQLSNLFYWLGKDGIEWKGNHPKDFTLKYQRPSSISIPIDSGTNIRIDYDNSISQNAENGECKINQYSFVSFYPSEPIGIDEYLQLINHIRNLLCLFTQTTIYPLEITAYTHDITPFSKIQVLYQIEPPINKEINIYRQLFSFQRIENKFETWICNWYKKRKILEPVFQLYFGSIYGRYVYLNLRFLCLVQALESYHSRTITNEEIKPDEHEKRIASILKSVPQEYKEWLEEELRYSNEPRLRKRLKDIINNFSQVFSTKYKEPKYFLDKVVKTRNYLTHYDEGLKKKALQDEN